MYQIGFPLFSLLGVNSRITCGFRGTLSMVNDMANMLQKRGVSHPLRKEVY
ncbi:MAG: hypothetical protein HQL06_14915 [Nitrospirae bacterium]|nr:hypothetical protein [Nitrospirota bacterium]